MKSFNLNRIITSALFLLIALLSSNAIAVEQVTYYHNDATGSPVAATDNDGNILWREEYRPYGKRLTQDAAADTNSRWFTGKQEEKALGISYFGARWYSADIGRFMAVDPVGFTPQNVQSFNRYAYANNNPYRYVDPNGESPFDIAFVLVDAVTLVGAVYSGVGIGTAAIDVGISILSLASPIPGLSVAAKAKRTVNKVETLAERGAALVKRNGGKNRVSISTPKGRTNIDLAGKPHSDVPTPHVQDFTNNIIPKGTRAGQIGSRSKLGDTRPATAQDLRTAARFLKSQNK